MLSLPYSEMETKGLSHNAGIRKPLLGTHQMLVVDELYDLSSILVNSNNMRVDSEEPEQTEGSCLSNTRVTFTVGQVINPQQRNYHYT